MERMDLMTTRNIELEEQLKLCHEDLKRKDDHIKALSSMEIKRHSPPVTESIESRAELASVQLQLSNFMQKLEECEITLKSKDEQIDELRGERQHLKEAVESLETTVAELRANLSAADKVTSEVGCANSRSELTIVTLQTELCRATDRIVELEHEVRSLTTGTSEIERSRETLAAKISQFYSELVAHLNVETDSEPPAVLTKVKELTAEQHQLRGEVASLKASASEREDKYLESRESLRAVMASIDKDKGQLEDFIRMKRDMAFEVDKIKIENKTLEAKHDELSRRATDLDALLKETKRILDEKEMQLSKIYLEKRESGYTATNVSREFDNFRESLAGLLGSPMSHCMPTEETIKERVRSLVNDAKEKENTIRQLDQKFKGISEQYERNYETSKETNLKARRVELEYLDLKDRIKQLEKELSSRDVTRDELRAEKEKFYHFLRRLAAILKMDPYTHEHDISLIFDGILDRTTQAIHHENDRNIDTSQTISGLKKRLRDLKDQLHSRDLHLELMRKKLTVQDDKIREAVEDADQRRDLIDTEDSLKHKLSKMQKKIEQLRDENKALKAELFECSDIKASLSNQNKEFETLQHNLNKLERVRQKQAEKIAELTKNLDVYDSEANQTRFVSDNAVQSLTSELKSLKHALDRARRSEKELLDFRAVVGRILGLCVDDLAIPNYDIIRRLEKLVSVPMSGLTVAMPMHHYPPKNGYEDSNRLLGRKRRSPNRTMYQDPGRPRSVSPIHDVRDSRKY